MKPMYHRNNNTTNRQTCLTDYHKAWHTQQVINWSHITPRVQFWKAICNPDQLTVVGQVFLYTISKLLACEVLHIDMGLSVQLLNKFPSKCIPWTQDLAITPLPTENKDRGDECFVSSVWFQIQPVWYENLSGVVIRSDNYTHKYRWSG